MTAPNNQPAPEGFRRLSSKWLETNRSPKDLMRRLESNPDSIWTHSIAAGEMITKPNLQLFTYATARTDLPREAYADDEIRPMTHEERKALNEFTMAELRSEPGDEVASERAEEKCPYCGDDPVDCLACIEHDRRQANETIATLRAKLDAKDERIHFLEAENRGLNTSVNLAEEDRFKVRHELQAKNVENDKLRAEAENLSEALGQERAMHKVALDKLTAELDAVRKERDEWAAEWVSANRIGAERYDAAQARCGALEKGLIELRDEYHWQRGDSDQPFGGGDNRIGPFIDSLLTPSQQPDNLKGGEPCGHESETGVAPAVLLSKSTADATKDTSVASNPQPESPIPSGVGQPDNFGSSGGIGRRTSNEADRLARADDSMGVQVPPAVNPSRPEPVKAGELDDLKAFLTEALTDQITQARDWERHYSNDPRGPVDKSFWDGKARAYEECLSLITDAIAPEGKATEGEG